MKVSQLLASGGPAYPSLEIVPPLKGVTKAELLADIRPFMEFSLKYINVTCHRDEQEIRRLDQTAIDSYAIRRGMSSSDKARFLGHLL